MTALSRAREVQNKIKALAVEVQTAITNLTNALDQNRAEVMGDQASQEPPSSYALANRAKRVDDAKARVIEVARSVPNRLATLQTELAQALIKASADSGAVASESARSSVRAQLVAGVPATAILEDAAARWDVDTVRAVRAEVGGVLMAKAGSDQHARTEAMKGRDRAEQAVDRVLARIGSGAEAEIAKIRLGSVVLIESAAGMVELAGKYGATGSIRPDDRLALAYAQTDADHALERALAESAA